jgi:hypothetical protein
MHQYPGRLRMIPDVLQKKGILKPMDDLKSGLRLAKPAPRKSCSASREWSS